MTGLLVSDELWSAYSEEPYFLLSSQTEGLAAQTFLVSQASGRTKHVYELYQKAEQGADPSLWLDYITPAEAEQGSPNPYLTPEWLESRRQELPRPVFEHYHLNSWGDVGQLLDGELVEACFDFAEAPQNKSQWEVLRARWVAEGRQIELGAGLDRALPQANRDQSVWTVTARVNKLEEQPQFYVLRQAILPTGARAEVLAEHSQCQEVFGRFPSICEVYQSADLVDDIPHAELGNPTAQKQQELFARLSRAVAEGRLHIPPDLRVLREQMLNMEIDTSSVLAKFGAPGQAADDCVYSLAWALAAADTRPIRGEITFSFDGESSAQSPEGPYPGGAGTRVIAVEPDPRADLSPERIAAQRFAERRRYRW